MALIGKIFKGRVGGRFAKREDELFDAIVHHPSDLIHDVLKRARLKPEEQITSLTQVYALVRGFDKRYRLSESAHGHMVAHLSYVLRTYHPNLSAYEMSKKFCEEAQRLIVAWRKV
jgi:hypothetical protein